MMKKLTRLCIYAHIGLAYTWKVGGVRTVKWPEIAYRKGLRVLT